MAKNDLSKEFCELPTFIREDVLTAQSIGQQFGWQIANFDLPEAWKNTCGENVKIAILDTGVDLTHPDLKDNLLLGYNVINPSLPPIDDSGHGCVSPDCLIHTSINGVEKIKDFYSQVESEEKLIIYPEGEYSVKYVNARTYCLDPQTQKRVIGNITSVQKLPIRGKTIEICLQGNIKYELTPWHPVYLIKKRHHKIYDIIRKRADEIVKGDQFIFGDENCCDIIDETTFVCLPSHQVCKNCGHEPKSKRVKDGPCKKCYKKEWIEKTPEVKISKKLAYLCGIILANGRVYKNKIKISSCTKEILKKTRQIATSQGWSVKMENRRILIYGKKAVQTIISLGVKIGKKSFSQDLPSWTGKCKKEIASAFIAGVVDGDGCISARNTKNHITTVSRCFAYKMAALLNSLGVSSSVSKPQYDTKIKSNVPVFQIAHANLTEIMVQNLIHPKKIERSKIKPKHKCKGRIVRGVSVKKYDGYFYDFTVEKYHNYIADGHFVSNSHITGIIAASNNDLGIVGVANCAKIIPIKVLNRVGAGRMDHVIEGIKIAIDKGADLICMSLGTRNALDPVYDIIKKATDAGIICFVAAGNAGQTTQLLYPAAYDITVSIGAVDENSMRAAFSCTGPNLDFVAPGVNIYSTVPISSYAMMSGTSQAAPFACGIAALILSYKRKEKPDLKMTKADYVATMKTNAMTVKNLDAKYAEVGNRFFQGFGIINPKHFIEWVDNKKVEGVAQTLSNAMSDLGMINENTDVNLIRHLSIQLMKRLKEFPKKIAPKKS